MPVAPRVFTPFTHEVSRGEYLKRYHDYLHSAQWRAKCEHLFAVRGRKCEKCGRVSHLQVHHITYDRLFVERDTDLRIECGRCHRWEPSSVAAIKRDGRTRSTRTRRETRGMYTGARLRYDDMRLEL